MSKRGKLLGLIMLLGIGTGPAVVILSPAAFCQSSTDAAKKDYDETVRRADDLMTAGNAFEAVLQYERAGRVAYNNKLDIDKAALDKKLAAARKVRDEKKNAPAPAAAPTQSEAEPAKSAVAPASAPDKAALAPMKDYEQTVKYGDGLAAVGEYLEAVKAYERARRLAYNNKLTTDTAALEAKIAAAGKAREAKAVNTGELVPEPLPPLPHPPGEKDEGFVPDHDGKFLPWLQTTNPSVARELQTTPTESKALMANLQRINEVVKKAALLNPPRGFDVYSSSSRYSFEATADLKKYLAEGLPLRADTFFSFPGYFERRVRLKATGEIQTRYLTEGEVNCGLRFHVNIPPIVGVRYEDARGQFFIEPRKIGEIGGLPVYGEGRAMLVIARPGDELWVPITMERLLKYLLPTYKSRVESSQKSDVEAKKRNEDYLRPEEMAKRRKEETAVRAKGGSGAEYEARHLEAMHRAWEEGAREELQFGTNDPKELARRQADAQTYKEAQAMLDSGDRSVLDAPACVLADAPPHDSIEGWKIQRPGTAGCRRVVERNPKLLNPKLPRSALQIIYVDDILNSTQSLAEQKHLREDPGNCVAVSKLIRQLDWQAIAGLLEK